MIKCYYLCRASHLDCFPSTIYANNTRHVNSYHTLSAISFIAKRNGQRGAAGHQTPLDPTSKNPSPLFRTQIRHSSNKFHSCTPNALQRRQKTKQTRRQVGSTIITGSVAHRVVIGHVAELRRVSHVGQVRFPVGPFLRPELAVDEGAQGTGRLLVRPVQQRSVDETRDADLLTEQPPDISRGYRPQARSSRA